MKKGNNKKGFTLVELLVVIAILAILAVVSVVGYTSFLDKARKSNDISLTKQMNTILQAEEVDGDKNETAYEAVQQLEEGGLDVTKLTPTTDGYHYVYDIKQNRMFLLDSSKTKVAPTDAEPSSNAYLFAFVGSKTEIGNFSDYSYYLKSGFNFTDTTTQSIKRMAVSSSGKSLTIKDGASVDVGENKNVKLTYESKITSDVVIRTTGDQATVTINPSSEGSSTGSVKLYGFAQTVAVDTSNSTSTTVSVSGACNELVVASGTIEVEETGIVFKTVIPATINNESVTIQNSGYVGDVYTTTTKIDVTKTNTSSVDSSSALYGQTTQSTSNTAVSGNTAGKNYEISTLSQLETFRDTVNAGATFEGKTVELKKDITLKDGWTPIGEGTRKVVSGNEVASGTYFKGTFNGNNYTIYNLNNKGFVPNSERIVLTDKQYCYGLFALAEGATFSNLKLDNVDIDYTRYDDVPMDSVGALVGYFQNKGSVSNIRATGNIVALDGVGGIVGRWYNNGLTENKTISISNCVNNVNVECTGPKTSKCAGILGYGSGGDETYKLTYKISDCTNNGTVKSVAYGDSIAAIEKSRYYKLTNCTNTVKSTIGSEEKYKDYITAGCEVSTTPITKSRLQ